MVRCLSWLSPTLPPSVCRRAEDHRAEKRTEGAGEGGGADAAVTGEVGGTEALFLSVCLCCRKKNTTARWLKRQKSLFSEL